MHAHLIGASVAGVGALTLARVAREFRWVNAAFGAWLLAAPLLYDYGPGGAIHSIVVAIPLLMVTVTPVDSEQGSDLGG